MIHLFYSQEIVLLTCVILVSVTLCIWCLYICVRLQYSRSSPQFRFPISRA